MHIRRQTSAGDSATQLLHPATLESIEGICHSPVSRIFEKRKGSLNGDSCLAMQAGGKGHEYGR